MVWGLTCAAGGFACIVALRGVRRVPHDARTPWQLIAAGLSLNLASDLLHDGLSSNVVSVGAYALLIAGAIELVGRNTRTGRLNSFLDATIFASGVALLIWEPVLGVGRSLSGAVMAGAAPTGGVAFFGLAALLVGGTRSGTTAWLVLGGATVIVTGEVAGLVLGETPHANSFIWPHVISATGRIVVGAAAWSAATTTLEPSVIASRRGRTPLIAAMALVGALAAIPIDFGLAADQPLRPNELSIRVGLRALLLTAVGTRLLRLGLKNEELLRDLTQSSARLSTVVSHTAEAVVFTDRVGVVLEWNRAAEDLFGVARNDIVGTNALDYLGQSDAANSLISAVQDGDTFRELTMPLRLQGRMLPIAIKIASVRNDDGQPVGFVAVARDDTFRIFADEARQTFADLEPDRALTRFTEALAALSPFDLVSLTSVDDDQYTELARLTRQADGQFIRSSPDDLMRGSIAATGLVDDGAPYVLLGPEALTARRAAAADTGMQSFLLLRLFEPATRRSAGFLSLGFRDPSGASQTHADALAAVGPDIAKSLQNMLLYEKQRAATRELHELNHMRDGFLEMVAHDLHSPLMSIGSAASVLNAHRAHLDEAQVDDMLRGIATTASQLTRLTTDLVSTLQRGEARFACHKFVISDLGGIVASAATGTSGASGNRLSINTIPDVAVYADPERVSQIVANLVGNALKFSRESVEVTLACDDADAVISVVDHGSGIPRAAVPYVFERYARIQGPAQPKGSGLGLFITRELVLAHNGRIEHRPTDGGGATFEVRLPLLPAEGTS